MKLQRVPLKPLPFTTENVQEFDAYFEALGLKFFEPYELRAHCEAKTNGLPPKEYWPNMVPTIRFLDKFRELLGSPLRINSAFRSVEHNKKVGGKSASCHLMFAAVDFSPLKVPLDSKLRDRFDRAVEEALRTGTLERAGRGYYQKGWIHFDTNCDNGARPLHQLTKYVGV